MIYDDLKNLQKYAKLMPNVLPLVLDFIASVDEKSEPGRRQLDGDMVMADLAFYPNKPLAAGRVENHERYIDIQVVLSGHESIYLSGCQDLELLEDAYAARDVAFYEFKPEISYEVPMNAGNFMIIMPGEGHLPGRGEDACNVCKIVFKVDKSLWSC